MSARIMIMLSLLTLLITTNAVAKPNIRVLKPTAEAGVDPSLVDALRTEFVRSITDSTKYTMSEIKESLSIGELMTYNDDVCEDKPSRECFEKVLGTIDSDGFVFFNVEATPKGYLIDVGLFQKGHSASLYERTMSIELDKQSISKLPQVAREFVDKAQPKTPEPVYTEDFATKVWRDPAKLPPTIEVLMPNIEGKTDSDLIKSLQLGFIRGVVEDPRFSMGWSAQNMSLKELTQYFDKECAAGISRPCLEKIQDTVNSDGFIFFNMEGAPDGYLLDIGFFQKTHQSSLFKNAINVKLDKTTLTLHMNKAVRYFIDGSPAQSTLPENFIPLVSKGFATKRLKGVSP